MTLACVAGPSGEPDHLRVRIASAYVLDHGTKQGLVTEILVPDMPEDADPHGRFWATAIKVYPSPAHSLSRSRTRSGITQPSTALSL